jgi:hypothetical protein
MADDDSFRYCIYCAADCYGDEAQHAAVCPSTTGVYPVDEHALKPFCPHCGESMFGPPCCMDCGDVIPVGSHYYHREVDPSDPDESNPMVGAPVYEVICLGCAAKGAIA